MSIYPRHGKRGTRWYVRYQAAGVEHRECAGPSRAHAVALLARRQIEALESRKGIHIHRGGGATVSELIALYVANARGLGRDAATMARHAKRVDDDKLGQRAADLIGEGDLDGFVARMRASGYAPGSINRSLAAVRAAMRWGERRGLVARGGVPHVAMLREPPGRCRTLTDAEEVRLLAACPPRLRALVVVALQTGARQGELLALTWPDVDLAGGWLHIERSKTNRRRDVPITRTASEALASLPPGKDGSPVFSTRTGRPWHRKAVDRAFRAACKAAGVVGLRFHDLRHSAASRIAERTGNLRAVQIVLGHSAIGTTQRYAHIADRYLRAAVDTLNSGATTDEEPEQVVSTEAQEVGKA